MGNNISPGDIVVFYGPNQESKSLTIGVVCDIFNNGHGKKLEIVYRERFCEYNYSNKKLKFSIRKSVRPILESSVPCMFKVVDENFYRNIKAFKKALQIRAELFPDYQKQVSKSIFQKSTASKKSLSSLEALGNSLSISGIKSGD